MGSVRWRAAGGSRIRSSPSAGPRLAAEMPRLSVCITHYNRPEKLSASLESLAAQTRPPDEVLLWDDHSPRDPTMIARAFQGKFRRFIYHRNERNLGMPGNLNAVIGAASGDLVANLHDADEYHPELLESWERVLISNPSAGIVFCGLDARTRSRTKGGRVWLSDFGEVTRGRDFFERAYVGTSSSPIWGTVMARRSVYQMHLPFDQRFGPWADVDMWMRICQTHDIGYVRRPLIILDDSDTAYRRFRWEKVRLLHSMHFINIDRAAESPSQHARWTSRQRRHSTLMLLRHFAGRACRLDIAGIVEGARFVGDWGRLISGRESHS